VTAVRITNLQTALAALALTLVAAPAHADLMLNTQIDTAESITATFAVPPSGSEPGIAGAFYVGPLTGTVGGRPFPMFCVHLFAEIQPTDRYAVDAMPLSALNPHPGFGLTPDTGLIAKLLTVGTTNSKLEGAALQIAIWDAVYAGGSNLPGGTLA